MCVCACVCVCVYYISKLSYTYTHTRGVKCDQVGRSIEEILRLVQAFQYTDVHGEVCPEGWKPGEKTVRLQVM